MKKEMVYTFIKQALLFYTREEKEILKDIAETMDKKEEEEKKEEKDLLIQEIKK